MMATLEILKYAFIVICALVSPLDEGITYIDGISFNSFTIEPIVFEHDTAQNVFYFYSPQDPDDIVFKIIQTDSAGFTYRYEIEDTNESFNIDLSDLIENFDLDYLKDNTIAFKSLYFKEQGEIEIYCIGNIVYLRTNVFEGMLFTVHD